MQREGKLVPVDAPENKGHPSDGFVDDSHQMIQHQLNNLKQNVDALLEHLSQCACPHVQEEEIKKKIILAADYLDSARDYVMSSHGGGEMGPAEDDGFLVMVEKHMGGSHT
jgi:hypothetical protein